MATIPLTAYLLVPRPVEPHDSFKVTVCNMLDELCALSGKLQFPLEEYGVSQVAIELVEYPCKVDLERWIEFGDLSKCKIVRVVAEIHMGASHWFDLINIYHKRVTDLIVAANIADLGSLENVGGVFFKDERPCGNIRAMNAFSLREASNLASSRGWPTLRKLNFADVWEWAVRQKGFLVGFGGGPTGRAINAFTHLFEGVSDPIKLFWAMVGLEALYVTGRGISEQMREKVWLLLGEQKAHKKEITQLYDFRSAFVHGDLDFVGMNCFYLPEGLDTRKHDTELVKSASLAQVILTATIQELVQRNWAGLSFSYRVRDLGEPAAG